MSPESMDKEEYHGTIVMDSNGCNSLLFFAADTIPEVFFLLGGLT